MLHVWSNRDSQCRWYAMEASDTNLGSRLVGLDLSAEAGLVSDILDRSVAAIAYSKVVGSNHSVRTSGFFATVRAAMAVDVIGKSVVAVVLKSRKNY